MKKKLQYDEKDRIFWKNSDIVNKNDFNLFYDP